MKPLRTSDERFDNLPDFPYEPRYCEVRTGYEDVHLRIHYIDEGPREAPVVLLLHGEPAWSFMWRRVIPKLTGAGYRAVAIDLPGFGRSDKPDSAHYFTFSEITQWVRMAVIVRLELDQITAIGHGLGGLIALTLATAHWRSIPRVLMTGSPLDVRPSAPEETSDFSPQEYGRRLQQQSASEFIQSHTVTDLPEAVLRAYDAPFEGPEHRVALGASLQKSSLLSDSVDADLAGVWEQVANHEIQTLFVSGEQDDIAAGLPEQGGVTLRRATVSGAGHFPAEDNPDELARICLEFLAEGR